MFGNSSADNHLRLVLITRVSLSFVAKLGGLLECPVAEGTCADIDVQCPEVKGSGSVQLQRALVWITNCPNQGR